MEKPFRKPDESKNVSANLVSSDELGTENKLKKLKLKVGGVTHTIHTKSTLELALSDSSSVKKFSPCPNGPKLRQNQDDANGNCICPSNKGKGSGFQLEELFRNEYGLGMEYYSTRGKTSGEIANVNHEPVRKSKRIPKRRALDLGFSGEDYEDAEIQYLGRLNASKACLDHNEENEKSEKQHGISKVANCQMSGGLYPDYFVNYGSLGSRNDSRKKFNSEKNYVEEDEEPTSDDEPGSEGKNMKKGSLDFVVGGRKQFIPTTRSRSFDYGSDVISGSDEGVIDFSNGLLPTSSKSKKGKLSEIELQLKKAEAARKRKMQSEKAAREAEAQAIRKILGQDSARKKKEEKLKKRGDEYAQEKSTNSLTLGSKTVRWIMGPTGTIVTFSEDIGLPSIFKTVPCSYPPPREKCAGPNCTNAYKYRDSKSKLPLCSLHCYRAIHETRQPLVAC
ncbi:putative HIT zinc finger,PAPA-1-like conserved region [Quillaja saponaria]|uniref:HIT zinc finger,PAPA-1-like conserved region n=1 Tax=Quillaja saponaria TaxID=32244 RepID=A0AAD7QFF0_QUISA|nr:putative HIT zinc finger,PAPA-1-like conserved region [Quillaja saponaria]